MLPNPNPNRNLNPNPEPNLPRDGEVARVLPAREHLLPRGLGFGFGFGFGFGLGYPKYHPNPSADLLPRGGALHHGLDEAGGREGEEVEAGEDEGEHGARVHHGSVVAHLLAREREEVHL